MTHTQIRRRPPLPVRTLVVSARFLAGRDLDGRERTNARWGAAGTELVDARRAGRWAHQSRRRRAGVRLATLVAVLLVAYGALVDPPSTATTVRVAAWLLLGIGAWVVVHKTRKWSHHNAYVVPLAIALADRLDISRHVDPLSIVRVPPGHRTNPDHPVRVALPATYRETDRQQQALAKLVASKAGIRSHDWEVQLEGAQPEMIVRAALVPPDEVAFSDAATRELIAAETSDDVLFLGRGVYEAPVWVSWAVDSPHLALSFGSGAGKSTAVRSLAAQTVHKGGRSVLFDFGKAGESHEDWCRDEHLQPLPGVEMYRDVGAAHDALIAWDEERRRRSESSWNRTGEAFQRTLLVLEELNVSTPKLHAYWAAIREQGDPAKSPAVQAMANLVSAGRSVKINCVAVAQRFDAACIGGGSVRASFMLRALSRFDDGARKMLIPEIKPAPRSSNHMGRMVLAAGGEVREVQGTFMTAAEAVEWSTNGAPQAGRSPVSPEVLNRAYNREAGPEDSPRDQGRSAEVPHLLLVDDEPVEEAAELVTLAEAADRFGLPLKTLRNARDRDGSFPEPVGQGARGVLVFRFDHLDVWNIDRARRSA